jgi:hypothetical protein
MSKKPAAVPTQSADVPCDPADEKASLTFWATAEKHKGLEELRAKRGRPQKAEADLKEQIALLVGKGRVLLSVWHLGPHRPRCNKAVCRCAVCSSCPCSDDACCGEKSGMQIPS